MPNLAPAERPTKQYQRRFFEEVMATAPGSVLEVGCGQGFFLKDAAKRGCRVVGIEVNRDLVTEPTEAGIEAQLGRAEKLPFGPLASMLQVDGWPLAVRDPPAQPSRFQ